MTIELSQVEFEKLTSTIESQETSDKKQEVIFARQTQKQRFQNNEKSILTNSEMEVPQIKKYCRINSAGKNILKNCVDSGRISARGYH